MFIELERATQKSLACPAVWELEDTDGNIYFFRLRYGKWRLFEGGYWGRELAGDFTGDDLDGVADWDRVSRLLWDANVPTTYPKTVQPMLSRYGAFV